MLLLVLAVGSLALLTTSSHAERLVTPQDMILERQNVGGKIDLNERLQDFEPHGTGAESRHEFSFDFHDRFGQNTRYLRFIFSDLRLADGEVLELLSPLLDKPVDTIVGPWGGDGGENYYSPIIPGPRVEVILHGGKPLRASGMIKSVVFQKAPGNVKSIFGPDDRQPVSDFAENEDIASLAKSIVFLSILNQFDQPSTCSGFLVNASEILTNKHCFFAPAEECKKVAILFGFDQHIADGVAYRCLDITTEHDVADDSIVLDYAIVRLNRPVTAEVKPIALHTFDTISLPDIKEGEELPEPMNKLDGLLIHHPAGEPKQVTKTNCRIYNERVIGAASAVDFRHRCDTLKGSSGSPVLAIEQAMDNEPIFCTIGLHHAAFHPHGPFMSYNRAVWMPFIAEKLSENGVAFTPCGN
ncbi:MAG: serine protease [Hyphomicrobiales bacterium]